MRILLLFIFSCALSDCGKPMTNEEIIKEVKKCEDAGLTAEFGRNLDGRVIGVQCGPKVKR